MQISLPAKTFPATTTGRNHPIVDANRLGKTCVMYFWPPTNLRPSWFLILLVCGGILMLAGCHTAPFHAASQPGDGKQSSSQGKGSETTTTRDSDWQEGARSVDSEQKAQYHEVHPGETLSNLAAMYGLSVAQLLNANSLDVAEELKPGQILKIPQPH
jgi:hypothetical protein